MSEQGTESSEQTPQEGTEQHSETKTFDAEYVDKLRKESAKYRTEAKANSEAAKTLAALEEANKSEIQKANDRLAATERERDEARVEGLRFKVAAAHGISGDDAELFLTGTDEETLTKQAKRLTDREVDRKKQGNRVPREGSTPTSVDTDERQFARELFGG